MAGGSVLVNDEEWHRASFHHPFRQTRQSCWHRCKYEERLDLVTVRQHLSPSPLRTCLCRASASSSKLRATDWCPDEQHFAECFDSLGLSGSPTATQQQSAPDCGTAAAAGCHLRWAVLAVFVLSSLGVPIPARNDQSMVFRSHAGGGSRAS